MAIALVAGLMAEGVMHSHKTVAGSATANPVAVVQAAADNEAAADAAAAEQKKRDDEAKLASLEQDVLSDMKTYFADPVHERYDVVTVSSVGLVKVGENTYEGMATMSANGGDEHDIKVHVTADERQVQWSTDQGALLPLFR